MKNVKIIFLSLVFFQLMFVNYTIFAIEGCTNSEISKLRSYASNINLSYDYYIENNSAFFNITINNIVPEVYIIDNLNIKYYYEDSNDGEIVISGKSSGAGKIEIKSALEKCYDLRLGEKSYILPTYNKYYVHDLCKDNSEYFLCKKWKKINYTDEEFELKMKEYIDKKKVPEAPEKIENKYEITVLDIIVEFYVKYYYIILIGIILICTIIMIISARKNRFDL